MNISFNIFITYILFISISSIASANECNLTVGIVVPLQHKSLDLIVNGFSNELVKICSTNKVKIKNSGGDLQLQKTILRQLSKDKTVDAIVTIGTVASQLAQSTVKNKRIIALAANEEQLSDKNTYIVKEELPSELVADFIHNIDDRIDKITIIHSMNDKIYHERKNIVESLKQYNISVQELGIANISDIYRMKNKIAKDSKAILTLKDHQVVSAISFIIEISRKNNLTYITLDEGSVSNGADVGIGVIEQDIGVAGAKIFLDKNDTKVTVIDLYHVFINKNISSRMKDKMLQYANSRSFIVSLLGDDSV